LGSLVIGLAGVVNVQTFWATFSTDVYVTVRIPDITPRPVLGLLAFAYVSAEVANRLPEALLVFHESDAHVIFAALAERSARSD